MSSISNSTPAAAAAAVTLCSHGNREGHLRTLRGKTEAQAPGARNQPVKAVLRLGDVAAMHQRLEDAIDAGLGDLRLLKNLFQRDRGVVLLQQLNHVERLGENRNQVQPLDLCLGQLSFSLRAFRHGMLVDQNKPFQA